MSKFRKSLSVLTTTAIAASMFTSFAVTSKAFDASISYADGQATATASGKLIAASYDENGLLTGVKLYDAVADTPVDVEVSEGDKLMLWDGIDGETMKPLADVYTVELPVEETEPPVEPTQPPVEETEPPVEETEPPVEPTQSPAVENKVYIDEPFTYDDHQIIKSAGNDVENAPNPVTLGQIVYAAGRRANGTIQDYAKIESGKLVVNATSYATSGRGVTFAFAEGAVPTTDDLAEGQVLEMSFDVKTSGAFEVTGFGNLTTGDLTTGNVHARIVLDKGLNMQYLIVTDADGKLITSKSDALAMKTFTGMSFRIGTAWVEMDNLKVETKDSDAGRVVFSVKDANEAAVADADIKITDSYSVKTDANGLALVIIPNGTYTAEASKSGYEHTKGMLDPDTANITVNSDDQSIDFVLSLSQYDKIPDTVTIENGQNFISAPKTEDTSSTAAFTVSVLDQFGIKVEDSSEYTLTWAVYPSGKTTADGVVSISDDGIVTVSKDFNPSGDISEYDVTATVVMNNAGLRGQTVKKSIFVGKNDIIYYEPIAWVQAGGTGNRGGSVALANQVTLPSISAVTLNMALNYTEGQRTMALTTNSGALVGLQLVGNTITAWTGWSGNSGYNQSGDVGKFANSAVLMEDYATGTALDFTFTIDTGSKNVTVSAVAGEKTYTASVPFTMSPTTLTGITGGQYRNYGGMTVNTVMVKEPDANYLSINGDKDFAKVSGKTITREYELGQSVIVPDETFTWTVSPAEQGVTVENGVLSVADTATAGSYTLTATSDINAEKTASVTVEIGDFQTIAAADATVKGAHAFAGIGEKETYAITKLVDSYGDDVTVLLPAAAWSSSNTDVATIDAATGELTTVGYGETTVTATITNGSAVTTLTVPVTVAQYYITADATGDSTSVDTSALVKNDAITGYQVTTSKDGKVVKQEVVEAAPATVDTTGADKVEIAPVFTITGLTNSNTKSIDIPADTYNFNITGAAGDHFDPYVNNQMLANNMLQGGSAVNYIEVNDVVVSEGYATLSIRDVKAGSSASAQTVTIVKSPSIVDRTKKVYVLGDSLVCIYANGGDATHNYQTGWGQVLQSYLTDEYEVVDLGNSGVTAEGLAGSAITQVIASGKPGDVMLLESGYNDRTYITQAKMTEAVKYMYNAATEKGVDTVLVSPNASQHDYKASPAWGSVMMSIADEIGAKKIDLAGLSYSFLYGTYGDNTDAVKATYNVSDGLHSTYNGAHKMASIVAGGMIDAGLGDMVNTSYVFTFTDSLGNTITCQAKAAE